MSAFGDWLRDHRERTPGEPSPFSVPASPTEDHLPRSGFAGIPGCLGFQVQAICSACGCQFYLETIFDGPRPDYEWVCHCCEAVVPLAITQEMCDKAALQMIRTIAWNRLRQRQQQQLGAVVPHG